MGCLCCKSLKPEIPVQTEHESQQVSNPLHDYISNPKPGDIETAFDRGEYIKVSDMYQSYLPTINTFSDEDIICVLAVLTAENRLGETLDPLWTLTKTRRVPETIVKEKMKEKMKQIM